MENEEKMISGEESHSIITEMINKTKGDIEYLAMPFTMLTGYIIPGYLLKKEIGKR